MIVDRAILGKDARTPGVAIEFYRAGREIEDRGGFRRKRYHARIEMKINERAPDAKRRLPRRSRFFVERFVGNGRLQIIAGMRLGEFTQSFLGRFDRHGGGKRDKERACGGKSAHRARGHEIDAEKSERVEGRRSRDQSEDRRGRGKTSCPGNADAPAMKKIAGGSRCADQRSAAHQQSGNGNARERREAGDENAKRHAVAPKSRTGKTRLE